MRLNEDNFLDTNALLFYVVSLPFSLEPIILLNTLIRQKSFFILNIRVLRLYEKKETQSVFLKVYWTRGDFLHTSWWFVAKSQKRQGKVLIILHNIFKLWAEF